MNAIGLVVAIALLLPPQIARSSTCAADSIGFGPTAADTLVVEYLSRCVGQVFTTQDTLLVSLTIWRPALPALLGAPRHLFIVDVDSTGVPIPTSVIVDGGSIVNFVGDGVHPVPYRFQFDPPAALPRRGRYCFVVPFDDCAGGIGILASDDDPYAGGRTWSIRTNNFADCIYPSGSASPMNSLIDIVFQAEFCDTVVPVRRHTWGELKAQYR